jgi:molybdate transport system substrate-binding protein
MWCPLRRAALALLTLVGAAGCADRESNAAFTVGAAAAMTEVVEEALGEWVAAGGAPGRASFGSSAAIARGVERGAPFDLVLASDPAWVEHLDGLGLLEPGGRRDLAGNRLVLVQPAGRGFDLSLDGPLSADLRPRPWTTGEPEHVPVGRYAKAALDSLGWWSDLAPTLVPAADVRAALRLVERGEVDWGMVYATDAHGSAAVEVVAGVDPRHHPPIVHAGGLVAGATREACAFFDWLAGDEGRRLFARHGFSALEGENR